MSGIAWTAYEDALLRAMWARGVPAPLIGERLRRTDKSVGNRVKLLELPNRYVKRETYREHPHDPAFPPLPPRPADTRTAFARMMGDPTPGRSALDGKINANQHGVTA